MILLFSDIHFWFQLKPLRARSCVTTPAIGQMWLLKVQMSVQRVYDHGFYMYQVVRETPGIAKQAYVTAMPLLIFYTV